MDAIAFHFLKGPQKLAPRAPMILASRIAQILQTHKDLLKHHSKIPILGAPLLDRWLDVLTRPGHESLTLT